MTKKDSTSWGSVSSWYDDLLSGEDTYQKQVLLPNLLRLLAPYKGGRVLDLACGQGFFSRAFHENGFKVSGVDISQELIDIARKSSPKEIIFNVAPADQLEFIKDESVDVVLVVLAIQNIMNVPNVFKECGRILRKKGKFLLVLNHPAFRIPKHSSWGFDENKNIQYRRVDSYLSENGETIEMNPGTQKSDKTISFHRPLQYYAKHLSNAGFVISRMEEWVSHKKSERGPREGAENRARNEFPLFLMIEAVSLDGE